MRGFGKAAGSGKRISGTNRQRSAIKGVLRRTTKARAMAICSPLGCEDENLYPSLRGEAGARRFFKERGIKWHRTARSGDAVGEDGPTRNMASSQVVCVNFLLPLAGIPGALAAAIGAIDDDVKGIVDIRHEGRTSPVEFEWIGLGDSLEGGTTRGANNTSVDAFVIADTDAGRRRLPDGMEVRRGLQVSTKTRARDLQAKHGEADTSICTRPNHPRSAARFQWANCSTNLSISSCAFASWRTGWWRTGSWTSRMRK